MTEFELKFEIGLTNLKSVEVAMQAGKARPQRLQASYFDTLDGALARHGVVVRLRKEGRRWVQTGKGATAHLHERLEHNVPLPLLPASALPTLDLSRHRGTPVGNLIDKALGLGKHESYPSLELLYSTDVKRTTRCITSGGSTVELALDQGRVFTSSRSQAICELEFELKEGVPQDAIALARKWCAAHGLWMSSIAKSMKGQRLRDTAPFGAATAAVAPSFARQASGHEMIGAVVQACLAQILPNMSELASGSKHPDHVHQLRVGIRRLRTALRELRGLTDAVDPSWEAVLVQTFRTLGRHRDQNHLARVLQPQLLAARGPCMRFDDDSSNNIADPGVAVRSADFQDALLGLLGFLHRENSNTAGTASALKKTIALRLEKLHTRALRDGKKFLTLEEAQQHDVRKRLKRLRYLIEFAAPLFSASKLSRMTDALKPVQDALGLYNDELMALQAWRALAADNPNAWFGIGWLTARRQPNAKRCRKALKDFAAIKPFWCR